MRYRSMYPSSGSRGRNGTMMKRAEGGTQTLACFVLRGWKESSSRVKFVEEAKERVVVGCGLEKAAGDDKRILTYVRRGTALGHFVHIPLHVSAHMFSSRVSLLGDAPARRGILRACASAEEEDDKG
ncbi:unnamed protein product [Prorocentrum cordatum]|uniref:Uncharacterized protein n=1 Tax=Prorocentrum cordatum TaxID=2364126 RepID=A0ABN9TZX2_9DINO|nr:unnamed protein product [Polarella glacialis]